MLQLKPERFDLSDYAAHNVVVSGRTFVADMSGALYWPSGSALIVSDLHLEKGSSFAASGQLLPPYDTRDTLLRLARVIDKYDADCVIALGDSFHDVGGAVRMSEDDRAILRLMQEDRRWVWICGNHDPSVGPDCGGEVAGVLELDGITLRHEPIRGSVTHEIAGHLHPAAKLSVYGHGLRRPCFVGNGRRLVMPAFGSLTGGLNVLDTAFEPLFGHDGFSVWMLGEEGLYPVATRRLQADRGTGA